MTSFFRLFHASCLAALLWVALLPTAAAAVAFPVQASADGRYLVDQNGTPFRVHGDAGWCLCTDVNLSELRTYLDDRKAKGFTTILVQSTNPVKYGPDSVAPAARGANGALPFLRNAAGGTWDGDPAFANDQNVHNPAPGNFDADFSSPNDAYFAWIDTILNEAKARGMLIVLTAHYLGYNQGAQDGWWRTIGNSVNTQAVCFGYGQYLGNRYKNFPNILWEFGVDMTPSVESGQTSESTKRAHKILEGIRAAGDTHLWTGHWKAGYLATDDPAFAADMTVEGVYTHGPYPPNGPTYGGCRKGYNHSPALPCIMVETNYENSHSASSSDIREYMWGAAMSTVGGAIFGNNPLWIFTPTTGWQNELNSTGSKDMQRMGGFLDAVPWYQLVPSELAGMKKLITAGTGQYSNCALTSPPGTLEGGGDNWVVSSATRDGRFLIAYVPDAHTSTGAFSVDMTALSGTAVGQWYDPTNGTYTTVSGSPFPNTGTLSFTIPGANSAGAHDWALVLAANPGPPNQPPTVATAAAANPGTVTGTTSALSVLGADDNGEAALTYTWTATGTPPAAVAFSVNSSNAAKNTTATFSKAGSYTLQATIRDAGGLSVTSSVPVTVSQTLTAIAVAPLTASVLPNGTQAFTASANDQFGFAMPGQPTFTWSVSGGGAISASGLFTAGSALGGPFTVTASGSGKNGTASVSVSTAPTFVYRINAGGAAVSPLAADQYFSGGSTYAGTATVSTAGVANAAPAAAYQSERNGTMGYTFPGLTAGAAYTVRLHFAEIYWNAANARVFNVDINGTRALTSFDIWTAAGGMNKAVVRDVAATASGAGQIAVNFTTVTDNAKVSAIEILTAGGAANQAPTVAAAAAANPNPVTGTASTLSVLGADDAGESALTYTWSTTGTPPAAVAFSSNGTNAAKSTTATFSKAGSYALQATITDAGGLTATSTVTVTVNQTLASIVVSPASATVAPGAAQTFTATGIDQFGTALSAQPSPTWSVAGGGTITSAGVFTAGATTGGPFTVTAASGTISGTASVNVSAASTFVYRINAGGAAVSPLAADQYFAGGSVYTGGSTVSTAGVANAAPAAVYQTERFGAMTYTFPGLTAGANYTVRLHFAEIFQTTAGQRLFNVDINGTRVLSSFDIWVAAGGTNKALVNDFATTATSGGQIAIAFSNVVDNAKISAIEILSSGGPANQAPTVATAAAASPNLVTGTGTALSVRGADDAGEAALTYTWAATGTPPAAVAFSANGTNAAKSTTATFSRAGSYTLQATITDAGGLSATSAVSVTVGQTLTAIAVAPTGTTVITGGTQQFTATATDQFGQALTTQPTITWVVSGGGAISASGLFSATTVGGPFTVTAASGATSGTASVTVSAAATAVYQINAGGSAVGAFVADEFFSGGSAYVSGSAVSTTGVANAAPASVYQSERYGSTMSYAVPGLTPAATYIVRLHFAEIYWTATGKRVFNVAINGTAALTNFDIFAAAGGQNKALVRDITATANASGQIVISFTTVTDNAKLSGLEIIAVPPGGNG